MNRMWQSLVLSTALLAGVARGEVKLASVFADGMVIQRDRPARMWGTADAGAAIDVSLDGVHAKTTADADGKWTATLPAGPAGGPMVVAVHSPAGNLLLGDVYRGDVWLCSGQSNMGMSLGEADEGRALAEAASDKPTRRLCHVAINGKPTPQTTADITWRSANDDTARRFPAVGYFFGDALLKSAALRGVPIGLIQCELGGTLAEAWAPREELAALRPDQLGMSMLGVKPTELYNGMIAPLGPIGLKGVIWYQGEGNAGEPELYPAKLSAVIRGWRKQFDNSELPFLVVQLPDYLPDWGGVYWQWIRDAQRQVADTTPHVYLVNALNTNDGTDLHPKPKRAIGERAALLARQFVYGEPIIGRGPVFEKAEPSGDHITVTFDTDGSTLRTAAGYDVGGFMLAGEGGVYHAAVGVISGKQTVDVRSAQVPSPQTVRYAWAGVPVMRLFNAEGLPAYPFRTDTLAVERVTKK